MKLKMGLVLILLAAVMVSCAIIPVNEIDLAGTWKFRIDEHDSGIDEQWYTSELTGSIELPGSMTINDLGNPVGYDTKFTGYIWKQYEDDKSWFDDENYKPYLSDDKFRYPFWLISDYHYVGKAWYQKEVEIPEDWQGKNIELFLERPHWETQVWINGKYLGLRDGLGVAHRYSAGEYFQPGLNLITICIDNRVKDINVGTDSHSVSDNTQSNWNGIVGDIKLLKRDRLFISGVKIFPDVVNKTAKLEIVLSNTSGTVQNGKLGISVETVFSNKLHKVKGVNTAFEINAETDTVIINYALGDDVQLWDEFNPNIYQLSVNLSSDIASDIWKGNFGMREFQSQGKGFVINGRPVFLRGTLECAIFPKTGFPPTDIESWERIITICKNHGLNHIRFHSWCPPEAAFDAADKLGFYYQVEASAWTNVGDNEPIDKWIYDESERMVAEYGNHPSFCLMAYGNEPHGANHKTYLTEFVNYWKARDSRRVYTTGAGYPLIPENDYHNAHNIRIQGWNANLNSIINREAPRSDYDWEGYLTEFTVPTVSHEIGQWCVYPNFKEIPKYDGVLKATNFEIFQKSLEAHGMLHLADDFVKASGKLQALCYKADIEAALRTRGFGGFQLLDLHDFPGQGTALVGVLDPFWDEKGYISPEEFRQFSNETVPLARFNKMVFNSTEKVSCDIEVAHYGAKELKEVVPTWQIADEDGQLVREGVFDKTDICWGHNIKLGSISEDLEVGKAAQYQLQVDVAGFINTWDFWVYPTELPEKDDDILVVSTLNDAALQNLEKGGKVLLTVKKGSIKEGKGGEVAVGFSSIFWNTAWTNNQKPHTLGILCDPEHPALAEFPTEYHSNYQWWDAMSHSNAISLNSFEVKPDPIVRIIDDWVTNRNLALLFEAKVGNGYLLMAGVDLKTDVENRPEARQLLYSLKKYMSSESFKPQVQLTEQDITGLFK